MTRAEYAHWWRSTATTAPRHAVPLTSLINQWPLLYPAARG